MATKSILKTDFLRPADVYFSLQFLAKSVQPPVSLWSKNSAVAFATFFLLLATTSPIAMAGTAKATTQAAECQTEITLQSIGAGEFVRKGVHGLLFAQQNIANTGVIIGESCVAVIDTGGSPAEGAALACAIAKLSTVPVCYVINTHAHPDHFFGNAAFAHAGVEFIAHNRFKLSFSFSADSYLARAGLSLKDLHLPDKLLSEPHALDLGGRTLVLTPHGNAHTDTDVTVHDQSSNTLWAGDLLFMEYLPVIGSSINGWISTMDSLISEQYRRVVPGHGPIQSAWPDATTLQGDYLRSVRTEIRDAIENDLSLSDATESVASVNKWNWQLFEELHRGNISRAYAELEWE